MSPRVVIILLVTELSSSRKFQCNESKQRRRGDISRFSKELNCPIRNISDSKRALASLEHTQRLIRSTHTELRTETNLIIRVVLHQTFLKSNQSYNLLRSIACNQENRFVKITSETCFIFNLHRQSLMYLLYMGKNKETTISECKD